MQRSSNSIGNLAAALAKAQGELVNPIKSEVGTVAEGNAERLFRYASLASGLDIVRKTLGQHEIATMQTTAIDCSAGIVNLTTMLAHSSGEWIASDWPVCLISDTTEPRRMGRALTYARRYGLFTLAGIAGEDDLDAPDPATVGSRTDEDPKSQNSGNRRLNGQIGYAHQDKRSVRRRTAAESSEPPLSKEDSALLRARLLAKLQAVGSGDEAAAWAKHSLPLKSTLLANDAQAIERAFAAKLVTLAETAEQPPTEDSATSRAPRTRKRPKAIDKAVLLLPEPRRIRDREHIKAVAQQPCLICGRRPCDAHHIRFAQARALARRVSDEFTVPLCRGHHRELHRHGDEEAWWRKTGVDPSSTARALWLQSHPLREIGPVRSISPEF